MVELTQILAVLLALGAALALASQGLFIRLGTQRGTPFDAVFAVIVVNLFVLVPVVAVFYYPEYGLNRLSWMAFIAAGLVGTVLGRMFKYTSISKIGASRAEPIVSSQALFASVLGVIFLNETVTTLHGIGVFLVVVGVATIAWETSHENPDDLPLRELLVGLLIPFAAALAYALEPIFARIGLVEGTPAPVGLLVKTVSAAVVFTGYLWWTDALPDVESLRSNDMRWFLLAGLANTLFLLGYYTSLSFAPVSIVVPIIISSTLFVVVLSWLFMPQRLEHVTWRLVAAATTVVGGLVLITALG